MTEFSRQSDRTPGFQEELNRIGDPPSDPSSRAALRQSQRQSTRRGHDQEACKQINCIWFSTCRYYGKIMYFCRRSGIESSSFFSVNHVRENNLSAYL